MTKNKFLSPYTVPRTSAAAILSVGLMACSAAVRCIYYACTPAAMSEWIVQFCLPVAAAIWFIVSVLMGGRRQLIATVPAVMMGVVFFTLKSLTFASVVHTALCILLYAAVLILYTLTVSGVIRTKILLYPLFGLPLLYHIFVEDMQLYILAAPRPAPILWLPEISVLCIMGALLSISVALQRRKAA